MARKRQDSTVLYDDIVLQHVEEEEELFVIGKALVFVDVDEDVADRPA